MTAPSSPAPGWIDGTGEAAIAAAGGTVHWLRAVDGVRLRAAHWPGGPRGTMLLLNGRADFIEKYLETVAELRRRGFAVWTLDWRGQGRSDRLLPDPAKGHVRDFGDYIADLTRLIEARVVPSLGSGPLALLAHSMGGNIALRYLAAHPGGPVQRAILTAPMVDFRREGSMSLRRALLLTGLLCAVPGMARRFNGAHRRAVLAARAGAGANPFTTCPLRLARSAAWIAEDPALRLGASTWGWSRAALRSVDALARGPRPAIPTLFLLAEDERITDNAAITRFAATLPQARLEVIPGARHELLCEADAPRARLWRAIDAFLGVEEAELVPAAESPGHV